MTTENRAVFSLGARTPSSAILVVLALMLPQFASAAEGRRSRDAEPARSTPAAAAPAAAPAGSFEAFRVITERNIFNPNRTGPVRAVAEAKPPRTDEIALVGTVEYGGQRIALFESAEVAFRKAVREGETLGDFTVRRVGAEGVDLARGDQVLVLRVAQQLRRPEGGDWSVIAAPNAPLTEARGGDTPIAPEIPADASEVLKRLMRQREKQFKK